MGLLARDSLCEDPYGEIMKGGDFGKTIKKGGGSRKWLIGPASIRPRMVTTKIPKRFD